MCAGVDVGECLLFTLTQILTCFYAERQNVPPFLPFLLGMPLYKGVEAREGFLSSLPSPSRVTGGIFRFPPVCEPQ